MGPNIQPTKGLPVTSEAHNKIKPKRQTQPYNTQDPQLNKQEANSTEHPKNYKTNPEKQTPGIHLIQQNLSILIQEKVQLINKLA